MNFTTGLRNSERVGHKRLQEYRAVLLGPAVFIFSIGCVCAALVPSAASADTLIPTQTIPSGTHRVWDESGSPYILATSTTLTINGGASLTINPGVTVLFGGNTSINGNGSLKVLGSREAPVTFTTLNPNIAGGSGASFPGWFVRMGSQSGTTGSGPHEFRHLVARNSIGGIAVGRAIATFEYIDFANSNSGFGIENFSTTTITHSRFTNTRGAWFQVQSIVDADDIYVDTMTGGGNGFAVQTRSTLTLASTTVRNVGSALALSIGSANVHIKDSLIENGTGEGIRFTAASTLPGATLTIASTTIRDFGLAGLRQFGGVTRIHGSKFIRNREGLNVADSSASQADVNITGSTIAEQTYFGISNSSARRVSARGNWWGFATGPLNFLTNPLGEGNQISTSVDFMPFLTEDPFEPKPTQPVIIVPGLLGSAQKNGEWLIDPIFHVYDNLIETLAENGYEKDATLFTFPYDWRNSNVLTAIGLEHKIEDVKAICDCDKVDLVAHSMGGLAARQYIQSDRYNDDVDQLIFLGTPHLGAPKAYLTWEGGETTGEVSDRLLRFVLTKEAEEAGYADLFEYIHERPLTSIGELLPVTDYLWDEEIARIYPSNYPANPFLQNLENTLNNLTSSGVMVKNIVGENGSITLSGIKVADFSSSSLWEHGAPIENAYVLGAGDGTVPHGSGIGPFPFTAVSSSHLFLPTNAQKEIYNNLTGDNLDSEIDAILFPNFFLVIKMLSPADFVVTSPDGKKIGKDFSTNGEFNEIPGAFYSGFGTDDEYVVIPDPLDGEYVVQTQGTGEGGEYTLATGLIGEDSYAEHDFVAHTLPGLVEEISIVLDADIPDEIQVTPSDAIAPSISVASPEVVDYPRGTEISVNVSFTDDTGVLNSLISLDGVEVSNGYVLDSFYSSLGDHSLTVSATDLVGNSATTSVVFRIVATYESTISDINRLYALGWIDDVKIKDSLVKKIVDISRSATLKEKKNLLESFIKYLGTQLNKHINSSAYEVLLEDANWLLQQ